MRGHILGVDSRTGDGLVAGDDGTRYAFGPSDWAHKGEPAVGVYVDFDVDQSRADQNRALSLFPLPVAAPAQQAVAAQAAVPGGSDRNKYIAAALAFVIGTLGIHRFYLGRTGSGIVMLVLTCTVFGLIVSAPWALIDMVRYLVMSDAEFARRYPREG